MLDRFDLVAQPESGRVDVLQQFEGQGDILLNYLVQAVEADISMVNFLEQPEIVELETLYFILFYNLCFVKERSVEKIVLLGLGQFEGFPSRHVMG